MSGLAPTLIIVRVAYGQSVDSVQQMMSIHFAEQASQQGTRPGTISLRGTGGIQSHPQNNNAINDAHLEVKVSNDEDRVA
ncbi:hypothetical protein PQX77_016180 [Marasmius sp. AFHP31]|nr:hypothetical protein PQX77_016180 [Marasmius sp. AFHP31]